MLRSVGATKKQIRKNVFYEATILGVIGIPLGLLSGFVASFILIKVCNYLLGAITIYLSSIKSAYKAAKISPLELIRNSAKIKIKDKKLRVPKFIKKIFGLEENYLIKILKEIRKNSLCK